MLLSLFHLFDFLFTFAGDLGPFIWGREPLSFCCKSMGAIPLKSTAYGLIWAILVLEGDKD